MGRYKGSKTLLMQGLCFFDMVQYQMKTFPLHMNKFRLQRCCHQAFASLIPACNVAEMDNSGLIPYYADCVKIADDS
jgi:hypothetical protein